MIEILKKKRKKSDDKGNKWRYNPTYLYIFCLCYLYDTNKKLRTYLMNVYICINRIKLPYNMSTENKIRNRNTAYYTKPYFKPRKFSIILLIKININFWYSFIYNIFFSFGGLLKAHYILSHVSFPNNEWICFYCSPHFYAFNSNTPNIRVSDFEKVEIETDGCSVVAGAHQHKIVISPSPNYCPVCPVTTSNVIKSTSKASIWQYATDHTLYI